MKLKSDSLQGLLDGVNPVVGDAWSPELHYLDGSTSITFGSDYRSPKKRGVFVCK